MPLVIIGTGGSAYDVLDIVDAINAVAPTWDVRGFLDDSRPAGSRFLNWPILGALTDAPRFADAQFINVIGSDRSFRERPDVIARTHLAPEQFATLVHPASSVSSRAQLGRGVCANFGCSVAGAVRLGDHVALGPGAIIGHDSLVGDFSLVAPAAVISGYVTLGRCVYFGAAAVVKQRLTIGDRALVGMGAVVTRDVRADSVVVGNPARTHSVMAVNSGPSVGPDSIRRTGLKAANR